MTGIIWYYTSREMGIARFNQLLEEYGRARIQCTTKRLDSATFENGDTWKIAPVLAASRGSACNVALIETGTPERAVHEIIFPCIKGYPYRAYNYY